MFLDGKIFDDFLTTYLFYSVILNYFPISKNLNITLITKYLQNYQKDTNITSNQHNVLILDTFFERKPLIFNDFRFFVVKTAPKLHRFKNFLVQFLHRLTLISEIAPPSLSVDILFEKSSLHPIPLYHILKNNL